MLASHSSVSRRPIRGSERDVEAVLRAGVLGKVDAPGGKRREGERVDNTVQRNVGDLSVAVPAEKRRL